MSRVLRAAVLGAALAALAGCGVPDGIAQAFKFAQQRMDKDDKVQPAAATPAPRDESPPPAPAAAPRDTVSVEALPPPR
jgi:predicted small lipoprotein YifL